MFSQQCKAIGIKSFCHELHKTHQLLLVFPLHKSLKKEELVKFDLKSNKISDNYVIRG